jgi:hypothetical protein
MLDRGNRKRQDRHIVRAKRPDQQPTIGLLYQSSDVGGADPVTLHDFQNDRLAQEFLKCGSP